MHPCNSSGASSRWTSQPETLTAATNTVGGNGSQHAHNPYRAVVGEGTIAATSAAQDHFDASSDGSTVCASTKARLFDSVISCL